IQDADFGGDEHEVVGGDEISRRTQAVTVERRADDASIAEDDERRTVPRLHQRSLIVEERADVAGELVVMLPRRRHQERHAVWEIAPRGGNGNERVIEARGIARAW